MGHFRDTAEACGPLGLTWIATDGCQESPLDHALVEVQLEYPGRCFPFSREWLDYSPSKYEMVSPKLAARVEQTDETAALSVERADIAALPDIASKTRVGKVIGVRSPSMFAADNVIYLMRRVRITFMKEAILAVMLGAFSDESPQRRA